MILTNPISVILIRPVLIIISAQQPFDESFSLPKPIPASKFVIFLNVSHKIFLQILHLVKGSPFKAWQAQSGAP